jgi:hypothetical protein
MSDIRRWRKRYDDGFWRTARRRLKEEAQLCPSPQGCVRRPAHKDVVAVSSPCVQRRSLPRRNHRRVLCTEYGGYVGGCAAATVHRTRETDCFSGTASLVSRRTNHPWMGAPTDGANWRQCRSGALVSTVVFCCTDKCAVDERVQATTTMVNGRRGLTAKCSTQHPPPRWSAVRPSEAPECCHRMRSLAKGERLYCPDGTAEELPVRKPIESTIAAAAR